MSTKIIQFIRNKDFKLLKEIGQGGLGKTVLLRDEIINEDFICKKYSPIVDGITDTYFEHFVEEIKLLHLLNHRNIVRVFNYYLYPEKKTGYILMEYVKGNEIHEYIQKNPQSINEVFIQLIEGFKYLEQLKILHRDIRPQNILVSNDGIVKIIDFGFGKQINFGDKFNKSISLNWRFAPPNEFVQKIYDFKTEIYFVGKLIEELILENQIESFAFSEILNKMTNINYENRINSFFEISRNLIVWDSPSAEFSEDEIEAYRNFADELISLFGHVNFEAEYIQDIELIILKLKEIYQVSVLEYSIVNNVKILNCFVKGGYSYYPKQELYTNTLKAFIHLVTSQPNEKKKIIFNHLWNRFDALERKSQEPPNDEIPF